MDRARTLAALACAALLASPARAAAPSRAADAARGAARPKVVALRFAWPRDLSADVRYVRTRTQTGRPESKVDLRGRLVVAARGEDLLVRYRGWTGAQGDLAALLAAGEPVTVVVGEDGRARAIEGVPEAMEAVRKVPPFSGDTPQAKRGLELLPASFEKDAQETWAVLVGFWTENDLEVGEAYETESEVPVPAVPGSTVRLRVEARATRWIDCPAPKRGRCVELAMRSEPDREDVQRVVGALMERLGAPAQAVQGALGDLGGVMEATLQTEPSTLVPHRLELRKTFSAAGPGGEPNARVDAQTWTFTYPPAPPRR